MRNRVALAMTTGATAVGLALAAPAAQADIAASAHPVTAHAAPAPFQAKAGRQTATAPSAEATVSTQSLLWEANVSASYLNNHGKKWVSGTFTPADGGITAVWKCWNNHDGGTARVRIYNVEKRKFIENSSRYLQCNNKLKTITGDAYRKGEGLRFVLQVRGKAHTTLVGADQ